MKTTSNDNHLSQNHHKKGVTFDAMEMLERNSDCIDRSTWLVSNIKMTMDRKQPPYKPKIYEGRSHNQNTGQQNFTPRNRSFSKGRNQGGNRGNYGNRNTYGPNYRNRSRGRWNNHRSGDRSNNYQNYNRPGNTRLNYKQNAQWTFRNRSQVGIEMKTTIMTIQEVGVEIDMIIDLFNREDKNLGPDLTPG